MLKIDNFNMYFNGSSVVGEEVIATFNANTSNKDQVSINLHSGSPALMIATIDTVKEDYNTFIDEVVEMLAADTITE